MHEHHGMDPLLPAILKENSPPLSRKQSIRNESEVLTEVGNQLSNKLQTEQASQINGKVEQEGEGKGSRVSESVHDKKAFPCNISTIQTSPTRHQTYSQPTIPSQMTIKQAFNEQNVEEHLVSKVNVGEISVAFQFKGEWNLLKIIVAEFAKSRGLATVQDTQRFLTMKKDSFNSCKCIIRACFSNEFDSTVYQLKIDRKVRGRAWLILLEGEESSFYKFCNGLLLELWRKDAIKISAAQNVEYFYQINNERVREIAKQCSLMITSGKKAGSSKLIPLLTLPNAEKLLCSLKKETRRLRELMETYPQITLNSYAYRKLQELIFTQTRMTEVFEGIYARENQEFLQQRAKIISSYSVAEIFDYLQIEEHYKLYKARQDVVKRQQRRYSAEQLPSFSNDALPIPSVEQLPYSTGISTIENITRKTPPQSLLQSLLLFNQRVKAHYKDYYSNRIKLSDMDDHLPITIFCVLAMKNHMGLLGSIKMILAYLEDEEDYESERKIATTLEAAMEYVQTQWRMDTSIDRKLRTAEKYQHP